MNVIFTIGGLHPESGGPARTVPALCAALAESGVEVEILSLDYGEVPGKPKTPSTRTTFVRCDSPFTRRLQWSPRFKKMLRERCREFQPQIIHDTGIWLSTNHAAARVASELNLPRIVSPRGMLTKWALKHKSLKKNIAWRLYQQRDLQSAKVLHATSIAEVEDFRAIGLKQPIAMIPNGVEMPDIQKPEFTNQRSGVRTVLFLSRIHRIKGLLNLVKAWELVKSDRRSPTSDVRQWRVVIAGPDEGGHLAEVKAEVKKQDLEVDFEFRDSVEGKEKWELYRSADLFVLPSHSENFGLVVAEALACGVPAIASRGTPWEELITHRCGWWVENRPDALAEALRDAMNRSDEERFEMGKRGRELVEKKYSWSGVAAQMKSLYEWVLGKGPKPTCTV